MPGVGMRHDLLVVPRHPLRWAGCQFLGVALQLDQVVEGIGTAQLTGVNQTHEQVAYLRSVQRPIEQSILSVKNGPLQCPFDEVIVERRSRFPQEQSQCLPMPQQILDSLAQAGVGLGLALRKLRLQPVMELLHHQAAVRLMKLQPLLGRQAALAGLGIVAIHLAQHLQYIATLVGEVLRYFYKLSSSVGEAVRQQNLHSRRQLGNIARERVAHLNDRARSFGPLLQHLGKVLASVQTVWQACGSWQRREGYFEPGRQF